MASLRAICLACAVAATAAFSPAAALRTQPVSLRRSTVSPVVPAVKRTAEPSMLLGVSKWTLAAPVLYALMSINEYATHRWYQHEEFNRDHAFQRFCQRVARLVRNRPMFTKDGRRNIIKLKGGGHVEHHAETYDDMSLKNDERWRGTAASKSLDDDMWRGTAFHWSATLIMTTQMLPSVLPTYALMGWSLPETFAILLPSMLVHAIVWNAVHPPMHGLAPVSLNAGFGTGCLLYTSPSPRD